MTEPSLRPLLVIGTRPEAIKMAPVVHECRSQSTWSPIVCFTGQHREMLAQVAEYFGITPDVNLDVMRPDQTLAGLTARCLEGLDDTLARHGADCVVAQGDTTTVLAASLVAFYRRLPFIHVEAGLRTGNLHSPWPEEFNRRAAALTTAVHCAPTEMAAAALRREGVPEHCIHVTGNTVIDALLWTVRRERLRGAFWEARHSWLQDETAGKPARMVLITGHRRENFGAGFESICRAIQRLASRFEDVAFVYPVHLNPNVREPVYRLLGDRAGRNVHLVDPAPYPEFVWLMDRATLILTDSGGVQEEAPSLGKPVLVMRDTTERPEAVQAGVAELVGTCEENIVAAVSTLLSDPDAYARRQTSQNPYGDGSSARRIVRLMQKHAWRESTTRRAA